MLRAVASSAETIPSRRGTSDEVSTMQTNASLCAARLYSPLLERDEVHCLWTRAAVLIGCELTTNNTREDIFSSRNQCGHTELRCKLRVTSGQLACALLRRVHAVWEDVNAKRFVSHVKESCLMLQRTSTNYLWFRHGTSKQLMPHLTKTSSATRQGPPKCSMRQGRCNLAVVLRQRISQWVVAPLIFDGGVGARHQQDPDDCDVAVVGSES